MNVFLIGGTGYIGRAVATALANHGHTPVVLSRSPESRAKVTDDRVGYIDGTLEDLDLLVRAAGDADAVVYLAVPGLSGASDADRAAISAILERYEGTDKAFVLTSGLAVYMGLDAPFLSSATDTAGGAADQGWRVALENEVLGAANKGVRSIVIRPSVVYGGGTASALFLALINYVAAGNAAFYIGAGANRIPTVHVNDLAELFVSALERAPAGANYNVASDAIIGHDLAAAVALATASELTPVSLDVPSAVGALGFAGGALAMDMKVSQLQVAAELGWSGRENSAVLELVSGRIPVG
jgi:nucleoside-diphosphate-sugar epimerase